MSTYRVASETKIKDKGQNTARWNAWIAVVPVFLLASFFPFAVKIKKRERIERENKVEDEEQQRPIKEKCREDEEKREQQRDAE